MKVIWTIVALLLLAGLVVIFQPPATPAGERTARDAESEISALVQQAEDTVADASDGATPNATESTQSTKSSSGSVVAAAPTPAQSEPDLDRALAASSGATETTAVVTKPEPQSDTPTAPKPDATGKPEPSAEPTPAKPEEVAAGAEFTPEMPKIAEAEILPSRFVKLPDGAISVDDAWTVRGSGSSETPYEVSWEYLSSAQDTYTPRLGEKKIPARIAFLSGKRVRISGYLAFPLVAPTASECLVMLNQWDGCCIGIPPTPYDAIEVKLATELKGWKKHTINFGAVEGTFKVEPYLVENWLVGLYLIENAKINTEL